MDDYLDVSLKISDVANLLIKKGGDTNKHHFFNNVRLIISFLSKYHNHIQLNYNNITRLIQFK